MNGAEEHEARKLEEILAGRVPPGEDLPGEEVRALASLAGEVRRALEPEGPRPGWVTGTGRRLARAFAARRRAAQPRRSWLPRFVLARPAWALAAFLLAVLLLGTTAGMVQAAEGALPGDALYGVKRSLEEVRLLFSLSPEGDAALLATFLDERLEELERLLEEGRLEDLDLAEAAYLETLERAREAAESLDLEDEGLTFLEDMLAHHSLRLQAVAEKVPPEARPAIERAMERSLRSRQVLEQLRQGGSPGEVAPGQQIKTPSAEPVTPPAPDKKPDEVPPGRLKETPAPSEDTGGPSQDQGQPAEDKGGPPEDKGGPPEGKGPQRDK